MTRQLTSAVRHKLLRSPHAKRPPQSGFVQVGLCSTIQDAGFGSVYSDSPRCAEVRLGEARFRQKSLAFSSPRTPLW
jgi:hypothetical protein